MGRLTRLNSAGSAVVGTSGRLLSLLEGRLLRVRSDLLLSLVAEALASTMFSTITSSECKGEPYPRSDMSIVVYVVIG